MKRIKTFGGFLDERAISADDVISMKEMGLVRYDNPTGIKETALVLCDFKDDKILGFSEIGRFPDEPIEMTRSAAEKGYGPMMYDFILMAMYPGGILPDRDSISDQALNIWKYYFKNREDVKKVKLKKGDPGYVTNYSLPHQDERTQSSVSNLNVMNTMYFLPPSEEYNRLLKNGEEFILKYKKKPIVIYNIASDFFDLKYKKRAA